MSYKLETVFRLETAPTEILIQIFTYLPAKFLMKCRSVCVRWMYIIDTLLDDELLWRNYCRIDYTENYKVARRKARAGLSWFDLYKSLTLWPKLSEARVEQDEFASASVPFETNLDVNILHNGILGVHTRGAIVYYDIDTLQTAKRKPIKGQYIRYEENSNTIAVLDGNLNLHVVRKLLYNPSLECRTTFENVKMFYLTTRHLFYVTIDEQIYSCDLTSDNLTSILLASCHEEVVCLSYTDNLHILTFQQSIYKLIDKQLSLVCSVNENILYLLKRFDFLVRMDWRVFYQWMFTLDATEATGMMQDVTAVRVYGETVFVGTKWGVLRIYLSPSIDGISNFFKSEPVRQWSFMERSDCPVLSVCPISQIEVMEAENGHTLVVVMPKKLVVLNLLHDLNTTSKAIVPYANAFDATNRVRMKI